MNEDKFRELINAVRTIAEECIDHPYCSTCPFGRYDNKCMIRNSDPETWEIDDSAVPRIIACND